MIITKGKSTQGYKARLGLRGDTVSEGEMSVAGASTAFRGSVQALLTLATLFHLSLFVLGGSQSFLQSDEWCESDKYVKSVPPFAILPHPNDVPRCSITGLPLVTEVDIQILDWDCYRSMPAERKKSSFLKCLIAHKPLFGGRVAPLIWFLRVSATLRMDGWKLLVRILVLWCVIDETVQGI